MIIVTNQSGVARGIFDEEMIGQVHHHLKTVLAEAGAHLDGIYYCPHHPQIIPCTCRKPQMGMIERAISEHPIDLSGSYVVGDKPLDMGLARGGMKGYWSAPGTARRRCRRWCKREHGPIMSPPTSPRRSSGFWKICKDEGGSPNDWREIGQSAGTSGRSSSSSRARWGCHRRPSRRGGDSKALPVGADLLAGEAGMGGDLEGAFHDR